MTKHLFYQSQNQKQLTTQDLFSGEGMAKPGSDRALAEYVGQEDIR